MKYMYICSKKNLISEVVIQHTAIELCADSQPITKNTCIYINTYCISKSSSVGGMICTWTGHRELTIMYKSIFHANWIHPTCMKMTIFNFAILNITDSQMARLDKKTFYCILEVNYMNMRPCYNFSIHPNRTKITIFSLFLLNITDSQMVWPDEKTLCIQ